MGSNRVSGLQINNIMISEQTISSSGAAITSFDRVITVNAELSVEGTLTQSVYLLVNSVKQYTQINPDGSINAQAILQLGVSTIQLVVEGSDGTVV